MNIIDFIPYGFKNAISREGLMLETGLCDRKVRLKIEQENNADHPIINIGTGYFIPTEEDIKAVQLYRNKENHRANMIASKVQQLDMYLNLHSNNYEQMNLLDFYKAIPVETPAGDSKRKYDCTFNGLYHENNTKADIITSASVILYAEGKE